MSARLTAEEGAALLAVARAAIRDEIFHDGSLAAARRALAVTPALLSRRACFVTLKIPGKGGGLDLRGCIGSTEARLPALDAVADAARDAAFSDPRFPAVTRGEYPTLVVSVSALTPVVPIESADRIDPGADGVVFEAQGRRALFLPEVAAEQGWSREELLEHLARKAGLPASAWRTARLWTFQSESFGERAGGAVRIPGS